MAVSGRAAAGCEGVPAAGGTAAADAAETPFSRLEPLMGSEGLARLQAATVAVIGLGGVGSSCAEALARGGVGRLILVDHDVVSPSNINRQAIAFTRTVGRRKAQVAAAMALDINPAVRVRVCERFVTAQDADAFLEECCADADYIVDAIDTVSAKIELAVCAERRGLRLISSMGAANKLHPECLRVADLYDTANCPLCRVMRRECRKRGVRSLRVLYSCERPAPLAVREGADPRARSNLGTASFMPPIMGQTIAGVVIRELAGLE